MNNIRYTVYVFGCLILLSSCNSGQKGSHRSIKHRDIQPQEARLVDVPITVDAKHVQDVVQDPSLGTIEYVYTSRMQYKEIVSFYHENMERMGWRRVKAFEGEASVLLFEKPSKVCFVSIKNISTPYTRRTNSNSRIQLLVGSKTS